MRPMARIFNARLFVIAIFGSILALFIYFNVNAEQKPEVRQTEYYLDSENQLFLEKQPGGNCETGSGYCTYTANRANPDPANPEHFDADESTINQVWAP